MKKLTVRTDGVRVIGNLIPDFGEITSRNYYISHNVTHTQTGTFKHLDDDRLVRRMVGSRITTTTTLQANKIEGTTYLFYVRVDPVNSELPITGGTVDLSYGTGGYITTLNLTPAGAGNNYAEAEVTLTLEGQGETVIKGEYSGYMLFHSSEASVTVDLMVDSSFDIPCDNVYRWIGYSDNRNDSNIPVIHDGYVSNNNSNYFVCSPVPLSYNCKLTVKFNTSTTSTFGYGLRSNETDTNSSFFNFSSSSTSLQEQHSGDSLISTRVNTLPTNTDVTLSYEVDSNGYITFVNYDNTSFRSNTPFTRSELCSMMFIIRSWNRTNAIHIKEFKCEYNQQRVYHTVGTDATPFNSTGGTGTATVEVVGNRTGIQAGGDSYNLPYLKKDIDLRRVNTISFDYYVSGNTDSSRIGIITRNATGSGGENFKPLCTIKNNSSGTVVEDYNNNTNSTRIKSGHWETIRIFIEVREATIIYNSTNGLVYKTVTIPTISSDTTADNIVKLGLQSLGEGYPVTAIRNIYIVEG